MHPLTARKRLVPVVAAIAILLGGAAPALAASTSSTTSESLTVSATISLTGVPASLTYGPANAGTMAAAPEFTATVSSNNTTGWSLSVNATDLGSILASNRGYVVNGSGFTATGGGSEVGYPGGDFTLANRSSGGSAGVFITSRVHIPAATAPGTFTGSSVYTAATNP